MRSFTNRLLLTAKFGGQVYGSIIEFISHAYAFLNDVPTHIFIFAHERGVQMEDLVMKPGQ